MPVDHNAGEATKQFVERCAPHLEVLRRSAMFALSRGAKELFHTNFLAFILELDEDAVDPTDQRSLREVRHALLTRIFGSNPPTRVVAWREAQSLDLVLAAAPSASKDGHPALGQTSVLDGPRRKPSAPPVLNSQDPCIAIIEAKLKALPDAKQLRRYDEVLRRGLSLALDPEVVLPSAAGDVAWGQLHVETAELGGTTALLRAYPPQAGDDARADRATQRSCIATGYGNVRRLLLAPMDPSAAAVAAGWGNLSWSEVLDDIEANLHAGGGLSSMLHDYAASTRALLAMLNEVHDLVSTGYVCGGSGLTLGHVYAATTRFRPIRIHDVAGKRAYSAMQGTLEQALQQRGVNRSVGEWQLELEVFMTRGTPGICIEYRLCNDDKRAPRHVSLGVQIQGTAFRRYLSASHPVEAREEHSLQSLTDLVRGTVGANDRWWAPDSPVDLPLRKFDAHAFLYVGIEAASWQFEALASEAARSMELAAVLIQDADFCEGAKKLMKSRRTT